MTITENQPAAPLEVVSRPQDPPVPVDPVLAERVAVIDAAADASLAMPGMPGRDEFLTIARTAKMISLSGAAPKAVRNNPFIAFHVAMVGRDLGISPTAAIELIDVIELKKDSGEYQLSLSPQLLNGQIRRLGLGKILPAERDERHCVAVAYGPTGERLGEAEFTWEDARMAGLVGEDCEPGAHVEKNFSNQSGRSWKSCGCNQGYKTYPKRMMWWRASGFAADDFFPEAGLGLYTAEELGAMVDEAGRAIDPANVDLPDGYEVKQVGPGTVEGADPMALFELAVAIRALPVEERADLRARWEQLEQLGDRPVRLLDEKQRKLAVSIVGGFEKKAKSRAGWVKADAVAETLAALAAGVTAVFLHGRIVPGPSDGPGAPETAPTADPTPEPSDAAVVDETPPSVDPGGVDDEDPFEEVPETAQVAAMKPGEVRQAAEAKHLEMGGTIDQLRKRLVLALIRERMARDK